jgi:hypothetical protein
MSQAPKWKQILEQALTLYSKDENLKPMLEAKKIYFDKTGVAHEEEEDYEARMSSFNNWYLFEFRYPNWHQVAIKMYLENLAEEQEVKEIFGGQLHSVFEYRGKNLFGRDVLVDLLHKKKLHLTDSSQMPSLIKNDLFIGRAIPTPEGHELLEGLSILPREARSNIVKECKKVRKYDSLKEESKFLLQVESLRSKWKRYGHLDASKIFVFNS